MTVPTPARVAALTPAWCRSLPLPRGPFRDRAVNFTAACPCGLDAQWTTHLVDTRAQVSIACVCEEAA